MMCGTRVGLLVLWTAQGARWWSLAATLMIVGCTQFSFGTRSPLNAIETAADQTRHREQQQYETRLLLDQFSAQLQLGQLAQTHSLRSEQIQTAQWTFDQVKLRSNRGVGRRSDLEVASAALAKAGIELIDVTAALKSGLASYEERYHERFEKAELVEPAWDERWPATKTAMLDMVPEAGRREAAVAWHRARRAADMLGLQSERVQLLDAARVAYNKQFAIGQRGLLEALGMERDYTNAAIERVGAHTELLNAKAAALALMGRLQPDDLPAVPKPGAVKLGLLFDPGEPGLTLKSLVAPVADKPKPPPIPAQTAGDGQK